MSFCFDWSGYLQNSQNIVSVSAPPLILNLILAPKKRSTQKNERIDLIWSISYVASIWIGWRFWNDFLGESIMKWRSVASRVRDYHYFLTTYYPHPWALAEYHCRAGSGICNWKPVLDIFWPIIRTGTTVHSSKPSNISYDTQCIDTGSNCDCATVTLSKLNILHWSWTRMTIEFWQWIVMMVLMLLLFLLVPVPKPLPNQLDHFRIDFVRNILHFNIAASCGERLRIVTLFNCAAVILFVIQVIAWFNVSNALNRIFCWLFLIVQCGN